jgi:ABC-type dipeptide/oligopeptide/nickel transport system permease component
VQRLWQTVAWIGGKLLFLISMALVSLLVLLMPMLRGTRGIFVGAFGPVYGFDAKTWWRNVVYHLGHLLHGQWLPPEPTRAQANAWRGLGAEIWSSLGVSLKLMGVALVAGLLLGIALGWMLSRMAPGWARRPAWGVTTFLTCLPDMLAATFLDLALVIFGRQRSRLTIWQEFLAPVLALTILVLPYVARVTAAAIADVSGQLFIRTALAKGVAPRNVVLRHMGRNVAVQIWTAMPVIVGILVSSLALTEYLMEIHGIGRALVLAAGPKAEQWYGDRYVGATVRQMTQGVLAHPFIEGAVAVGARPGRLLWRHILPQMAPRLASMFTLEVPSVMVMSGRWWFWAPFGALLVAVTAFTLLGEGLQRRFGTATEWQYRA